MQTSYAEQGSALVGMKADSGNDEILSRVAEGAVPFGRYVNVGTDPDTQCDLPDTAADITTDTSTLGVALKTHAIESSASGAPQHVDKDMVSVMHKGRCWVIAEDAVTPASAVYVRFNRIAQQMTIVFDADLVTSNTINGKINGVAISEVTFNVDHDTTMGLLETEVETFTEVVSATVGGAGNRTLTIVFADDATNTLTEWVVAAGASQAGVVTAESVPMHDLTELGAFRSDSDDDEASAATAANLTPGARWLTSAAAGALAVLELDL